MVEIQVNFQNFKQGNVKWQKGCNNIETQEHIYSCPLNITKHEIKYERIFTGTKEEKVVERLQRVKVQVEDSDDQSTKNKLK